jgi:hypothetical protein
MSHIEVRQAALPDGEYLAMLDTQPAVSGLGGRVMAAA